MKVPILLPEAICVNGTIRTYGMNGRCVKLANKDIH